MQVSQESLNAMADKRFDAFVVRVVTHLKQRVSEAAEIPQESLDTRVRSWIADARAKGFSSERALTFWCEVSMRAGDEVWQQPALGPTLSATTREDADRIEAILSVLEAA